MNSEYKQYTKELHQGIAPNSQSKKGQWENPNQPQRQIHPEQLEMRDKISPTHVARNSKIRLEDPSLSMTQPNFENQTGNFFSPTQEIYFSNTNLSLINETDPQHLDAQQQGLYKTSPSFFENNQFNFHNRNPSNTTNLSHANSNIKQRHIMPTSNERPHLKNPLQPINTQAFDVPASSGKKQSQYTPLFNENITPTSNKEQFSTYRNRTEQSEKQPTNRANAGQLRNNTPPSMLTRSEKELKEMKVVFFIYCSRE